MGKYNNNSDHSDVNSCLPAGTACHSGRFNLLISIIAAIGENRELGRNGKIPWYIPEDLEHFKKITSGHPVIMGRKTFESIGKPLPNRTNIIITRNAEYKAEKCIVVQSIQDAIKEAEKYDKKEIFIIGGGEIYKQSINFADKLYLTIVHKSFEADTHFPDYSEFSKIISSQNKDNGDYNLTFLELLRG